MADQGRREVSRLRLMVELTEVCLTVLVGGRSSLASVVDGVVVEAAQRTVPKRREDGRPSPRTLCLLPIVFGNIVLWRNLEGYSWNVTLIDPALKLLVHILVVPSFAAFWREWGPGGQKKKVKLNPSAWPQDKAEKK